MSTNSDPTADEISAEELHELISDAECGDPTPWSKSQEKLILRALRQLRAAITKLGDYNECVFQMSEIDKSQTYRIRDLERELSEVHEANAIVTRERNAAVQAMRPAHEPKESPNYELAAEDCYMYARRVAHGRIEGDWSEIIRFCEQRGMGQRIMRSPSETGGVQS